MKYDLAVIGSGPAGHKAAINAAKLGKTVALIERAGGMGGVCVNTGTIPSKSLREAILYFTGHRQRLFYGPTHANRRNVTMDDLLSRTQQVIHSEVDVIRAQAYRNAITLLEGNANFLDSHRLRICGPTRVEEIEAEFILIAVGSKPHRPKEIPFEPGVIIDSDQILTLRAIPSSLIIIGGGVIGVEYACMFAAIGVQTTLLDQRDRLLPFVDTEIADCLTYQMRQSGIRLKLGESLESITTVGKKACVRLESGKELYADCALLAAGRQGNTDGLNLEAAGLESDARGRLVVNEHFQTDVPHIFAAGDVIGFPSLAATSMEQGRLATSFMFGQAWATTEPLFPIGIYTVPEMSMVGQTEAELTKQRVPYEVGIAPYREISRGKLIGDVSGMLKIVFHRQSRRLLGVHIIGEGATELVHIGQTAMAADFPIDYFVSSVFNYPTLAECYRVAALDGINRIRQQEAAASGTTVVAVPQTPPECGRDGETNTPKSASADADTIIAADGDAITPSAPKSRIPVVQRS